MLLDLAFGSVFLCLCPVFVCLVVWIDLVWFALAIGLLAGLEVLDGFRLWFCNFVGLLLLYDLAGLVVSCLVYMACFL